MDLISFVTERLIARLTGPMSFRFILQPTVAILIGIRDGRNDAKAGTPPFVYDVLFEPARRRAQVASAVKSLKVPVMAGALMDLVAQYVIFGQLRVIPALIVGILVLALPYAVARAFANRFVTMHMRRGVGRSSKLELGKPNDA